MTRLLCLFSIYGLKQDVWFRNTESIIIVDYLQLMTAGGNGGGAEAGRFLLFPKLKSISKELNVPVIALSQLSRAVETRGSSKDHYYRFT
jgi:replicative DNA helicase